MTDKMREVWDAHDKARNKAWREEPGTFDTLDAFKAGAAWQAAKSVPVVGEPVAYLHADKGGKVLWSESCVCEDAVWPHIDDDDTDQSLPVYRKPTHSITAAELERLRKDAERYRWLRDGNDTKKSAACHIAVNCYGLEWDTAIDAAIAGEKK